ncbi:MAG TPA: Dyp-type peroxidase [Myxococcota bacterium]|nr:Dyp-type peroxidase [Myxococcota bacterium]
MDEKDREGTYTSDIQGNILRGFHFKHVRFVLVGFVSEVGGRAWTKKIRADITDGSKWNTPKPEIAKTIAFTHCGLAALGVKPEILAEFPDDFSKGMRGRREQIGDSEDLTSWDEVFRKDSIHALVSVYGDDPEKVDERVEMLSNDFVKLLYVQEGSRLSDREHFGFRDGISQPIQHDDHTGKWKSDVAIREFLIFKSRWNGGKSKDGDPGLRLGELGTYLVYRKLEQRVDAFLRFVQGWTAKPVHVAAKIVGRWPNGTPVTAEYLEPDERKHPNENGFDFRDDPDGHKCPVGAHISRVNPRGRLPITAGKHRILRRGVPYGSAIELENYTKDPAKVSSDDRGLVFVALNASIENQFEFVQHDWINDPKFNGLNGVDPLAHSGSGPRGEFSFEPGGPSRPLLEDFVRLRGGEYFFVPSMDALDGLGDGDFS